MSFTVESIKEYEQIFQSMTVSGTKVVSVSKLRHLMQLCGTSPTIEQLERYERSLGKEIFSFGDFLDIVARQMETETERQMDHLLYRCFAHCDGHIGTPKEGYVNITDLIHVLCESGPEPVPTDLFQNFLDKNGLSGVQCISIAKFIQLFGKNEDEE